MLFQEQVQIITLADVKIYSPEGSLVIEAKTTRYRASFMIDITPRFFISSNYIWQNSLSFRAIAYHH